MNHQSRRFDLSERRALVVGASRGIGQACAIGLAEAGADVALAARDREGLAATAARIQDLGRRASVHPTDVRLRTSFGTLVPDVLGAHPRIDILVYASGANVERAALDMSEEEWDDVIDTNLSGAFFCAQAVGRHMVDRGQGRIIFLGSTFSVVGFPSRAAYAASKGGLLQLTRVLALEWASHGVNVNAVGPTATRTVMNEELFQESGWQEQVLARIPKGRPAVPEDVVGAVIFLAAPASEMITGQILLIDGGWTAI